MSNILVTGAAGFIGFHLSRRLLENGYTVTGIDNLNSYYEVSLKEKRLDLLSPYPNFSFKKIDFSNLEELASIFDGKPFEVIYHLGAQAGVRYSLGNPHAYIQSNITGFVNILEMCRSTMPNHLIFASSSSVYGLNQNQPYSTENSTEHPVSMYAATKKSNEMLAHSYSNLFGIPCTGLRFFTVYGAWGRPDMAYFSFAKAIVNGKPIKVFNNGNMFRDFTYIDDIVEALVRIAQYPPKRNPNWNAEIPNPATSSAPYRLYNIGNNNPVALMDFIHVLEDSLGKKAIIEYEEMQPGDVYKTWADSSDLFETIGFSPNTPFAEGIQKFADWFLEYHKKYTR